jgi:hypothetical protein
MCRPRNQFQLKCANVNTSRMSALGQKRTLFKAPFYDCFAPKSGHVSAWDGRNYFEYTPLIKSTTECRRSYRRVSRPLVRLARSAIFSIALGQPRSSSFMAFSVPRYLGRSRARLAGRPDIWPSQALWPDAHAPAFSMPRSRQWLDPQFHSAGDIGCRWKDWHCDQSRPSPCKLWSHAHALTTTFEPFR